MFPLRSLNKLLMKLKISDNQWLNHPSYSFKLKNNLEKINTLKLLRSYEQEIKDYKTKQRP